MPGPTYNYQPQWMNNNPYAQQNYLNPSANFQQPNDQILTVAINSPQQVDIYPVAAGNTVMLIDYEHGKLYAKTNPANGLNPIVKIYNFSEDTSSNSPAVPEYASVNSVKELKSEISEIKKMLEELTK